MTFFLSLVVDGALAGLVYALIALAFVLVYRATRMINFAQGEWVLLGAILVAFAAGTLYLGAIGALVFAAVVMVGLARAFNRVVLDRLATRPAVTLIMATLGLSVLMRGVIGLLFGDTPRALPFDLPGDPIAVSGIEVSRPKALSAVIAMTLIGLLAAYLARSRTGIAIRAAADDVQAAMAAGIDIGRQSGLVWSLAAMVSLAAGLLWTLISGGGGVGLQLLAVKILPVVVIGGLDSLAGTLAAAVLVGIVESLAAGFLGPVLGYGVGGIAACVLLLVVLLVRPYGLLGRVRVERV